MSTHFSQVFGTLSLNNSNTRLRVESDGEFAKINEGDRPTDGIVVDRNVEEGPFSDHGR